MLILTRKPSETITIGNKGEIQITITIISINGGQVRLGVEAPKDIPVNRSELWERIKEAEKNTPPNDKKDE